MRERKRSEATYLRLTDLPDRLFESDPRRMRASRLDNEDREWLFFALICGRVRMKLSRLRHPSRETIEAIYRLGARSNEGYEHLRLKEAAVAWMKSCGAHDAMTEVWTCVGRSDAASESANWIVECGNTQIEKLRSAMFSGTAPRFTLIPYRSGRALGKSAADWLHGIDFTWNADEALAMKGEWRTQQQAAAARRRAARQASTPTLVPDPRP